MSLSALSYIYIITKITSGIFYQFALSPFEKKRKKSFFHRGKKGQSLFLANPINPKPTSHSCKYSSSVLLLFFTSPPTKPISFASTSLETTPGSCLTRELTVVLGRTKQGWNRKQKEKNWKRKKKTREIDRWSSEPAVFRPDRIWPLAGGVNEKHTHSHTDTRG